jgi:hypothetical protein
MIYSEIRVRAQVQQKIKSHCVALRVMRNTKRRDVTLRCTAFPARRFIHASRSRASSILSYLLNNKTTTMTTQLHKKGCMALHYEPGSTFHSCASQPCVVEHHRRQSTRVSRPLSRRIVRPHPPHTHHYRCHSAVLCYI